MSTEIKTFLDIQDAVLRRGKIDDTTENRTAIKEYVNTLYQQICREEAYRWAGASGTFILKKKYTTGTVAATQDSDIITGTSTSWVENDHRGSKIHIAGSNTPFNIIRVASATSITLDSNWTSASTSSLSHTIYRDQHGLFPDLQDIRKLRIPGLSTRLQPRPIGPNKIDELRDRYPFREGTPKYYTVFGKAIYTQKTWATFNLGTDFFEDTLDSEPKNPCLIVWPAIHATDLAVAIRYTKTPYKLVNDNDEPWIPYEDRAVLVWGVLAERFLVNRDQSISRDWERRYMEMKRKMAADIEPTDEELLLQVDATSYSRNRLFMWDEDEIDV